MFSVVFGMSHPRLCEELPKDKYQFFDIGEQLPSTIILKNLMREFVDINNSHNLKMIFEDFCKSRTLENDNNQHYQRLKAISAEYQRWFNGNKTSATKMYLVERRNNKVVNIHDRWLTYRQKPEYVYAPSKKKSSL